MSTIQTICKLCHKPIALEIPDDIDGSLRAVLVEKLAPCVVHNVCGDNRYLLLLDFDRSQKLEQRASQWPGICPPRYQDTVWEQIPLPHKENVLKWQYGPKGLVVHGPTGGGKTRAVFWMLKQQYLEGRTVVAMTNSEFIRECKQVLFEAPSIRARWSARLANADILFIDDLGKSRFTDSDGDAMASEEFLWDVCEIRWDKNLPCIFTTNDNSKTLRERMGKDRGEPFIRRLREFCISIGYK